MILPHDVPLSLDAETAQLWLFPLTAPPTDAQVACLTADEVARAAEFRFQKDRTAFVVAHATLRMLLGTLVGQAPAALAIVQAAGEKPFLAGRPDLGFSLSHGDGFGLIGLAYAPIGVDLERVRPMEDADDIARHYFALGEIAALATLPQPERERAFFACWTRKEAYVKALGLGLSAPLDRFEVSVDPRKPALLEIEGDGGRAKGWSLWGDEPRDGLFAAAAVEKPMMRFDFLQVEASP